MLHLAFCSVYYSPIWVTSDALPRLPKCDFEVFTPSDPLFALLAESAACVLIYMPAVGYNWQRLHSSIRLPHISFASSHLSNAWVCEKFCIVFNPFQSSSVIFPFSCLTIVLAASMSTVSFMHSYCSQSDLWAQCFLLNMWYLVRVINVINFTIIVELE